MRLSGQVLALLAAAALSGGAWRATRSAPLPWRQAWSDAVAAEAAKSGVRIVTLAETRAVIDAQAHLLLDARSNKDYLAGHLPGALSLPALEMEPYLPQVMPLLTPAQPLLVYCSGTSCDESLQLANLLHKQGFTNLVLFAGGMTEWTKAGLQVER